jgi:hypothetical protein
LRTGRSTEGTELAAEEVFATAFLTPIVNAGDLDMANPWFGVKESFPLDAAVTGINDFRLFRHNSKPPFL